MEDLARVREDFVRDLAEAKTPRELDLVKAKYLGKRGVISARLRELGKLPPEERREKGRLLNQLRDEFQGLIEKRRLELLDSPAPTDWSLPGRPYPLGNVHPIRRVIEEMVDILVAMGFEVAEGPEIEWDRYNFTDLNIPPHHPARDMHATMFITDQMLLRTHTSPVQIRVMLRKRPPIRIIAPGKVYRLDPFDASHAPAFHQIEALYIDKGVDFAELKGTIAAFLREFYGEDVEFRFLPSYFPFTEPSAEVYLRWGDRWLEIMGCGLVHPNVLRAGGIDPNEYSGFALGLGVERVAMLRWGIDDIRLFYENDVAFLEGIR